MGYLNVVLSHARARDSSLNQREFFTVIRHVSFRSALLVLLATVSACATLNSPPSSSGNPDVITREDMVGLERLTALQVVERLHPQWLQTRGLDSFEESNEVVVYVDNTRRGGIDELRRLNATEVGEIRYLDSREATTQFGAGHPSGAIFLLTQRGPN